MSSRHTLSLKYNSFSAEPLQSETQISESTHKIPLTSQGLPVRGEGWVGLASWPMMPLCLGTKSFDLVAKTLRINASMFFLNQIQAITSNSRGKNCRSQLKEFFSRLYFGKVEPDTYPSHPLMNSKGSVSQFDYCAAGCGHRLLQTERDLNSP